MVTALAIIIITKIKTMYALILNCAGLDLSTLANLLDLLLRTFGSSLLAWVHRSSYAKDCDCDNYDTIPWGRPKEFNSQLPPPRVARNHWEQPMGTWVLRGKARSSKLS
jgi:hypothetical protein